MFCGLVLGCIKTKFCNKICVWQHFSSSTRFASFCTAAISIFSQKIGLKNCEFHKNSEKFRKCWQILLIFWKKCDFGAVQRSALCRSRRELSDAYLLAKFGFDTAETEPCEVCVPWGLRYLIGLSELPPSGTPKLASNPLLGDRERAASVKSKWKIKCSWKWKLNVFQNEN